MLHEQLDNLLTTAKEYKEQKIDYRIKSEDLRVNGTDSHYQLADMLNTNQPDLFGNLIDLPFTRTGAVQLAKLQGWTAATRFVGDDLMENLPGRFGDLVNDFNKVDGYGMGKTYLFRGILPIEGYYEESVIRSTKGSMYTTFDAYDVLQIIRRGFDTLVEGDHYFTFLRAAQEKFGEGSTVRIDKNKPIYELYRQNPVTPDRFNIGIKVNAYIQPNTGNKRDGFWPTVNFSSNDITNTSISALPGMLRSSCWNSYVPRVNRKEVDWNPYISHIGTRAKIAMKVEEALYGALFFGGMMAEKMWEAQQIEIRKPVNLMAAVLGSILTEEEMPEAIVRASEGMEGQNTAKGVIDGLTYAAHGMDERRSTFLEEIGGTVMWRIDRAKDANGNASDMSVQNLFARTIPQMAEVLDEES